MNKNLKPGWSYKKLDELGFVGRGKSKHRPRNDPSLYGGKHPFIQTAEVTASEFYIIKYSQTYSDLGLAQSKLWDKNTLCIVNAGENTAETAILKFKACFPDSIIGFIANSEKADVRFIKYYLTTIKPQLRSITKGATQDNLSVSKLLLFDILTPPLPIQRKIAGILSAYDDLIENNTRRIEILEEMARSIYREWFVNFRFPSHEQVQMVDSELGLIPEGWEIKKVSEVANFYRGKSYKSAELVENGGLPFLNLKCIKRDGGFRDDGLKRFNGSYKETQTARVGDIIMAVTDMTQERRIVARSALVPRTGEDLFVLSMDLVKIAPKDVVFSNYLYGMLRFSRFADQVKGYANGANVLHLNPSRIEEFKFAFPPKDLRKNYASFCGSIYQECEILILKNQNLRKTRDLLLPRLISGEIDVENLDINTGEIAA